MIRAAILCLGLTALPLAAQAQAHDTRSKLMLSTTGEVTAAPDLAFVSAGVISQAQTAAEALSDNAEKMNRVFTALRAAGIAERDIQTSNLNVSPVYASNRNSEEGPRITGYRASNQVSATLRDLDGVGAAIDAMVSAGANNVSQSGFGLEDDAAAMDEARRKAMAELLEMANLYAEAGGFELGAIYQLSESGNYRPRGDMVMASATRMESGGAPSPVAPGELSMSVTVNATFGIQY